MAVGDVAYEAKQLARRLSQWMLMPALVPGLGLGRVLAVGGLALLLAACGGGGGGGSSAPGTVTTPAPQSPTPVPPPPTTSTGPLAFSSLEGMRSTTRAATVDNPREAYMLACTVQLRNGNECSLRTLPLLGMEFPDPSVNDIMTRVLVSHDWMGVNFRRVLETMPREVRLMTRALSAVVISHDIRPSFYTGQTGAIYLDPAGLWLTPDEQATVDTAPDFRAGFGNALAFRMPWRYVRDNEYVTRTPSSGERTVEDIRYRMAALLLHELAHANDFFSPARVAAANPNLSVLDVAVGGTIPSRQLAVDSPLQSLTMLNLARVSFHGATATVAQQGFLPGDVAGEFPADYASDYYGYSTTREDYAMLFEEALMLYLFDIDRDVGITNNPSSGAPCADYVVEWGVRNRVTDPLVRERAVRVIGDALPEAQGPVGQFLMGEEPPTPMVNGVDWCTNRHLDEVEPAVQPGATPRRATPRRATPRRATPRRATPRRATPRQVTETVEDLRPWL